MKKINMIIQLTVICTIVLHSSYSYGATLERKDFSHSPSTTLSISTLSPHNVTPPCGINISSLLQQGDSYHDQKHYLKAIQYYREALQSYAQSREKKPAMLAQIYNNMGMSYLALKDHTQTDYYYKKALSIRQELLDEVLSGNDELLKQTISEATGKSHHNIGILSLAMHHPKAATQSFRAALKTEWQHHIEAVDTQYYLARAYLQEKCYHACEKLYKDILEKQVKKPYLKAEKVAIVEKNLSDVCAKIAHIQKITLAITASNTPPPSYIDSDLNHEFLSLSPSQATYSTMAVISLQCPICYKKFSSKEQLKVHQRVHTGEKPFQCVLCDRKFTQKQSMKRHLRVHTGEKPFQCTVCFRKFSIKHNMIGHMKRIHPKAIADKT